MRVAIVVFVVMGLGLWLITSNLPMPSYGTIMTTAPALGEGRGEAGKSPAHPGAGRDEGRPIITAVSEGKSSASLPQGRGGSHATAVTIPEPIEPTPALPSTLELVSLPAIPGAGAAAPKSISRAQAVESVSGSKEFQETVNPIARLYLATFGRFPDYEGLNYYTGQREEARPLHEIATEFTGSREFELRYGQLDNAQFVELIFTNVLGNPSQADVRNYWVAEIEAGRMTRGQVLVDLAESGAFRERSAAQVFVSTAYTEILHRTPDPNGYNYWVAQLQAGQPPSTVINGLLGGR